MGSIPIFGGPLELLPDIPTAINMDRCSQGLVFIRRVFEPTAVDNNLKASIIVYSMMWNKCELRWIKDMIR